MAYVPKQIPDEQENQFARTAETTPFPQGAGSAGAGAEQAPGAGSSTQFGSNAAKLSDYLNANKEQVSEMGQQIAGDLTQRYGQTMSDIDSGLNQFNQQAQGGYTPPDQARLDSALKNPTDFVKDQKNVQDFQNWYSPQYGGPQTFEGSQVYSNLNNQVNSAVQNAGLTSTQSGLGTYMNQNLGAKDWSEGMRLLDTALIQRDKGSAEAIKNAAAPYQNLSGYLFDTSAKGNDSVKAAKKQVEQSGADVRGLTQGATDAFTSDLQSRVNQARTSGQTNADALQAAIQQGSALNADERKLYGIDNWDDILSLRKNLAAPTPFADSTAKYGVKMDLNPYFSTQNPQTAYTMQNVGTSDDYAREAALQQLTGNRFNMLPDDLSAAGTAPKSVGSFNDDMAAQDMRNKLLSLDTQFIDQYKDFNLGAGKQDFWIGEGPTEASPNQQRGILRDPFQAQGYQSMVDIFGRNPNLANDGQKSVANQLQQWLTQLNTLPADTGGGTPDLTGGRLRTVNGTRQWWDGSGWTTPPAETKSNPDGTWSQFNYETGQYDVKSGTRPTLGFGGGTSGVF